MAEPGAADNLGEPAGLPDDGLVAPASSLAVASYRAVLGHFASGVTVLTGTDAGVPVGLTCQAFFSLSLDPMLVALGVGRASTSWPRIVSSGVFCVNVLAEGQEAIARNFSLSGTDKFAGIAWEPCANGAPRLSGVLAWVACRIGPVTEIGDHLLVVGEVLEAGSSEGSPLLFYRGGFVSGPR